MRLVRARAASCLVLAVALALPCAATAAPASTAAGTIEVRDSAGALVAVVVERPGEATRLDLPAGRYVLDDDRGGSREVVVPSSGVLVIGEARAPAGTRQPDSAPTSPSPSASSSSSTSPSTATSPSTSARSTARRPRRWTRWGAPLLATFVPGLGHAVAGRPGPAFGIFAGATGLLFGSIALGRAGDRREGAAFGARGKSATRESLRQLAFVGATDTLALLWLGQIADAWVVATGKRVRSRIDHVVSLAFTRASAVGIRPGEPAIARYDDWTVQLLGQVSPRVMVGLSDLGLHLGPRAQVTVQGGVRVAVRALERARFWLVPALGVILQGTSARGTTPLAGGPPPRERGRFAAVPYVQLEGRIFVLDRLSLDVAPRLSVPLGTRFYGKGAAIPRWAPTFELAAGPTVYF